MFLWPRLHHTDPLTQGGPPFKSRPGVSSGSQATSYSRETWSSDVGPNEPQIDGVARGHCMLMYLSRGNVPLSESDFNALGRMPRHSFCHQECEWLSSEINLDNEALVNWVCLTTLGFPHKKSFRGRRRNLRRKRGVEDKTNSMAISFCILWTLSLKNYYFLLGDSGIATEQLITTHIFFYIC